jgi:hypothetical protein
MFSRFGRVQSVSGLLMRSSMTAGPDSIRRHDLCYGDAVRARDGELSLSGWRGPAAYHAAIARAFKKNTGVSLDGWPQTQRITRSHKSQSATVSQSRAISRASSPTLKAPIPVNRDVAGIRNSLPLRMKAKSSVSKSLGPRSELYLPGPCGAWLRKYV